MDIIYTTIYVSTDNLNGHEIIKFFNSDMLIEEFNIADQCSLMQKSEDKMYDICPEWLQETHPKMFNKITFTLCHADTPDILTFVNTYYKTHDNKLIYPFLLTELKIKHYYFERTGEFHIFKVKLEPFSL